MASDGIPVFGGGGATDLFWPWNDGCPPH